MNTLWMTRLSDRGPREKWMFVAAVLIPVGLCSCGTPTPPGSEPSPHAVGANDPAWITHRPALPAPDTDRINYDANTRTLTLYDLPRNERWLVQLPGESIGRPVPPQHKLPDVDMAEVHVYYTRPGQRPSASVSVKQIQDSGSTHISLMEQK
jgi:hypothetical protein